jgi:protocatechuate 3,4-dioxygenase beta subunit
MKKICLWLVVVVIVVGVGAYFIVKNLGPSADDARRPAQDQPKTQQEPRTAKAPTEAGGAEAEDAPREPAAADEKAAFTIAGQVLDADGRPVAGADVIVVFEAPTDEPARTTTDASGRFRFDSVEPQVIQLVLKRPPLGTPWNLGSVEMAEKSAEELAKLAFTLDKAVTWHVKVQNEQEQPLAGALVKARSLNVSGLAVYLDSAGVSVRTDENGLATFSMLQEGSYMLAVTLEGYPTSFEQDCHAEGDNLSEPYVVTLEPPASIAGIVLAPDERAVPEARVACYPCDIWDITDERPAATTTCDSEGRFQLDGLRGGSYMLVASAAGYSNGYSSCVSIASGETETGCTVTLNQDAEIAGRVIDLDKNPVDGVGIELNRRMPASSTHGFGWSGRRITVAATTTGPDGRFRLEHCSLEDASLLASKTGYENSDVDEISTGKPLTIVLIPGPTVSILVTKAETGKPLPGATVHDLGAWNGEGTETDEHGRCTITSLPSGQRYLFATAHGLASPKPIEAELVCGETTELVLPLEPSRPIRGSVTDAATGKPIERANLVLSSPSSESQRRQKQRSTRKPSAYLDEVKVPVASTNEEGLFEIEAPLPELTQLTVEAEDYCDETIYLEGRDLTSPLAIQLRQGAVLAGKVFTTEGLPIPHASVSVSRMEQDKAADSYEDPDSAATDEAGRFRFGGLGPGTYRLHASHDEFISSRTDPFELSSDQVIDTIDIVLNRGGRIEGTVTGPTGEPVHEATVVFLRGRDGNEDNGFYSRYRQRGGDYSIISIAGTDSDGHYASSPLPPGGYRLEAFAESLICPEPLELAVAEGTLLEEVNFTLGPGSALSGTVVEESGAPVPGAALEARVYERGNQNKVTTGQDGAFAVSGFAKGDEVYLSVNAEGYQTEGEMRVAPAHDIEITLKQVLTLTGRVVDKQTQEPVELFSITNGTWSGWFHPRREAEIEHHPDGRFTIEVTPVPWSRGGTAVQIAADGYAPAAIKDIEGREGEKPEEYLVELVEGATLVLTATANGQPVADVEIESVRDDFNDRTDAYGQCVIKHLAAAQHKFATEHPEFAAQTVSVEINEGDVQREVTVALDRGGTFRGRVVAKLTQQPVAGANVMLWEDAIDDWTVGDPDFSELTIQTGPDGSFEMSYIPPGRYLLRVRHADYAPFEQKQRIAKGEAEPLLIQLYGGGRVVGTVTDPNGVPQRGAMVAAVSSLRQALGGENTWTESDEQGNYTIDHLAPGRYRVAAAMRGEETFFRGEHVEWQRVVVRDGQDTRADFVLGGGAAVFGQITRAGQPVSGGMIIIISTTATVETLVGGSLRSSIDESGQYRIEHVKPGTYRVMGWFGRSSHLLREFTMGTTDLRLDIQLGAFAVTGIIYDELSQPLAGADVSLIAEPKGDEHGSVMLTLWSFFAGKVRTGEGGDFSLDCEQPGTYRVYASAEGYASRVIPIEQRPNQSLPPLHIQLEKACTIGGKVRAAADELPRGMLVIILDEDGRMLTGDESGIDPVTGKWQIDKVGPGRYTIMAKARGYALVTQEVSVTRGQDTTVDVDLDEGHDLAVAVRDSAGRPVPGAQVTVTMEGDPVVSAVLSAMTTMERELSGSSPQGAEGRVVVPHLSKGEWTLRVQADGYEPTTTKARVTGDSGNVTVTLKPAKPTGQ